MTKRQLYNITDIKPLILNQTLSDLTLEEFP
jgi:hypothetical protein